jgi:hypothetical protein
MPGGVFCAGVEKSEPSLKDGRLNTKQYRQASGPESESRRWFGPGRFQIRCCESPEIRSNSRLAKRRAATSTRLPQSGSRTKLRLSHATVRSKDTNYRHAIGLDQALNRNGGRLARRRPADGRSRSGSGIRVALNGWTGASDRFVLCGSGVRQLFGLPWVPHAARHTVQNRKKGYCHLLHTMNVKNGLERAILRMLR